MTRTIGHAALAGALVSCLAAVFAPRRSGLGRRALVAAAGLMGVAVGALAWALATGDFSLVYVADATSRTMSWPYRLGALWGGMEGSLLLWAAVLCGLGAWAACSGSVPGPLRPGVRVVCGALGAAFVGVLLWAADPFRALAVPALDGGGLTPVLEHPAMLYHPPLLYLGQVALVVPFALTVAALALRPAALDAAWLAATRRSLLVAWCFLSVGMLAGAHWAYRELGWGGFWAWDPVENGSLLPWLAATAFLHSAVVVARRGRVRAWTAALALAAFALALLGGFLSRSGTTESVHAFAEQRGVGRGFLAVFVAVVAVGAVFLALRWREVGRGWAPVGPASREAALLANNALLVAVLLVVLVGTVAPVVSGWAGGGRVGVAPRFFATFTAPAALCLLALAGVGPSLPWSGRRRESAGRGRLPLAAAGAALGLGGSLALGFRGLFALAGLAAAGASLALLAKGFRDAATSRGRAVVVAHAGMVLLLAGVLGSTQGDEVTAVLGPGQTVGIGRYCLAHEGISERDEGRRREVRVRVAVLDEACRHRFATLRPGLDTYDGIPAPLPETALRSTPREDLLVTVTAVNRQLGDEVTVEAFTRPLVLWVWVGGLLTVAGGAWALRASGRGRPSRRARPGLRSGVGAGGPAAA